MVAIRFANSGRRLLTLAYNDKGRSVMARAPVFANSEAKKKATKALNKMLRELAKAPERSEVKEDS